ncbi:MAG: hypothetical protein ACSHYB_14565 [Roseibacillus sp.]
MNLSFCAVEDETVFSLEARFPEPESVSSTDLIGISQWSGQMVKMFFGLLGGTANGAEVAVEGIRFLTFTKLEVEIVQDEEGFHLKWPALATGWELEGSTTLDGTDWSVMDVALATLVNGEALLSLTGAEAKEFFRLREKGGVGEANCGELRFTADNWAIVFFQRDAAGFRTDELSCPDYRGSYLFRLRASARLEP